MSRRFENKVAVITGAASGLGREVAIELAKEGAKLTLVDVNEDKLQNTTQEIEKYTTDYIPVIADVSKEDQVRKYVQRAVEAFGTIDIFFNNAGISDFANVKDVTEEQLDRVWGVNVKGVLFGMKHVIPVMEKHGGGSIINTGSVDSFNTDPGNTLYATSKHALLAMSKCAALEEADYNIRINTICPGPIYTDIMEHMTEEDRIKNITRWNNSIPMKRLGEPIEVAKTVLFLASEDSSYITASKIVIDGGFKHE